MPVPLPLPCRGFASLLPFCIPLELTYVAFSKRIWTALRKRLSCALILNRTQPCLRSKSATFRCFGLMVALLDNFSTAPFDGSTPSLRCFLLAGFAAAVVLRFIGGGSKVVVVGRGSWVVGRGSWVVGRVGP